MRIPTVFRSVAPMLFSVAILALPSVANASTPTRPAVTTDADAKNAAGLFSLTVRARHAEQRVDLVVEKKGDGYTGVFITHDQQALLENVKVEGDIITASLLTNIGRGDLKLRITNKGLVGTLHVGKGTLNVGGERVY
ncbi:MAG: hypothetical protein V4550_00815 [Gemmatimonadota bacterium]